MPEKEYIEREEAEKRLFQRAEIANSAYIDQTPYQIMMLAQNVVHLIPAADVRPVVRGKWRLYSPLTDTYECDKCGYQVIDESFRTNYCPNCGADMRAEEGE